MKRSHIIAILLIAVSVAAIMSTVADAGTYADFTTAMTNEGKEYHVVGKLNKEKEMHYDPHADANLFSFYMIDNKGVEKKVTYRGAKPQDFEHSEQIVVIGEMESGTFDASSILMKCPSKYNGQNEEFREFKASEKPMSQTR